MWHDNVTDEEIEELKNNKLPYCFLSKRLREIFAQIEISNLRYLSAEAQWGGCWKEISEEGLVYHLWQGWRRPEPAKKERYEYCEIYKSGDQWFICLRKIVAALSWAMGGIGFAGIEYEEWPGRWFSSAGVQKYKDVAGEWQADYGQLRPDSIPATPKRVRFLVSE